MHTEAHLFSVPNDCLWYDKLWGPSQRVVTLFQFIIIIMIAKTLQMKLFISNIFMPVKLMHSTKECVMVDFFPPVIRSGSFLSCSRDLIKLTKLVLPLSWTSTLPHEQLQSRCDFVSTYRSVSLFCLYPSLCW